MTGITIATAVGGIATKVCRLTSHGPVWTDYPLEKWWHFREVPTPSNADGWAVFLEGRVNDFASCCLYGRPINANAGRQRRLLHPSDGDPATLREVARDYLVLDFDSVLPVGISFLKEPTTAVGAIIDRIEDLSGCAFALAISCRAAFKAGVRAKAIVQLRQPMLPSEMRCWAKAVNARFGMKLLDPAVLAPAQPIYLARPILYGVHDPFPQRVYLGFRRSGGGGAAPKIYTNIHIRTYHEHISPISTRPRHGLRFLRFLPPLWARADQPHLNQVNRA